MTSLSRFRRARAGLFAKAKFPNVVIVSVSRRTYHKDSYMAHRRGETLGYEGRYRRTPSSPNPSAAPAHKDVARNNNSSTNASHHHHDNHNVGMYRRLPEFGEEQHLSTSTAHEGETLARGKKSICQLLELVAPNVRYAHIYDCTNAGRAMLQM